MSAVIKMEFCSLPATPYSFNREKFLAGDKKQVKLYKDSKTPNRDKTLSYETIQKTLKTELTELKNAEKEKRLAEKKEQNESHQMVKTDNFLS